MAPLPPEPSHFADAGGGRRLHVHALGAGLPGPAVVLESALGGSSLGWVFVERGLAGRARTLSYDRAGLGWSSADAGRRELDAWVRDLEVVLPPGPALLVGHSFGALVVSRFASLHPDRTAGLVLADPPALGEWAEPDAEHRAKLDKGIRLCRRGAWAARCGVAQLVAWLVGSGALKLAASCATLISGGKLRTAEDFNFTPATKLPPELKPAMRWIWSRARFYDAMADQMEALPAAARLVAPAPPPPEVPVTVLSAADTPAAQRAEHVRWAARSASGEHRDARASGHWIPLEEPELVVAAVRDRLDRVILAR